MIGNYVLTAIAIAGIILGCYGIYLLVHQIYLIVFAKGYFVSKAAKELKITKEEVIERFNTVLSQAEQNCADWGVHVRFTHHYPCTKLNELGMGTNKRLHLISYSPNWIYLVVTKPRLWTIAFMQSVGHEFNHRFDARKGKGFCFRSKEERRLYYWLCEVRNDFEGIFFVKSFCPVYSRKNILNAIEKKAEFYDKAKKPGKYKTMTHPSWKLRVALLKKYEYYCVDVIEEVARAAGCTNNDYILAMHSTLLPF